MAHPARVASLALLVLAAACRSPEVAEEEPAVPPVRAPESEAQDRIRLLDTLEDDDGGGPIGGIAKSGPPEAGFFYDDGAEGAFAAVTSSIWGDLTGQRVGNLGGTLEPDSTIAEQLGSATWRRSTAAPNSLRLTVGDDAELPLEGLQVNVWVDGFRARVVIDAFFRNDRVGWLEGTFHLRLPEGASPHSLAFGGDVTNDSAAGPPFFTPDEARSLDGRARTLLDDRAGTLREPREARLVPRERAAHAYTDVVRERVDPALLEWAGAGVFRARVFPLMPYSLHRVVVGYETDLTPVDGAWVLDLALPEGEHPVALDVHAAAPVSVASGVDPVVAHGKYHYSWRDPEERSFSIRVEDRGGMAIAGRDEGGAEYFATALRPELPADPSPGPARAVFLVDTSYSSAEGAYPLWLDLLDAVLEENEHDLREFAVLFFDVSAQWWRPRFTPNTEGARADVRAAAEERVLEGATDLAAALREGARPGWGAAGLGFGHDLFLFSDGASTWGEDDRRRMSAALAGAGALFAYSTGAAGTDPRTLDHLARETGGAVFSVAGEAEVAAAARAHRTRPMRLEAVRVAGGRDLLLRGRPRNLFPGQVLFLAGRGRPAPGAPVELDLVRDGALHTLAVPLVDTLESDLAPRAYGEIAVRQLEELGHAARDEARAFATHFRVPGETCSLLMLESEADYARYEIEPQRDAEMVAATEAAELVRTTLAEAGMPDDPRERLLDRLRRLETLPGFSLELPADFLEEIAALPPEALSVVPPPLVCEATARSAADVDWLAASAERRLDAVRIEAEAARRRDAHGAADALRVLSTKVELRPGDGVVARDVAFAALELGRGADAYHLIDRVVRARPWEPQGYLHLAACALDLDRPDLAMIWFEVAVSGRWDSRFGAVGRIAGAEYLHFLRSTARTPSSASYRGRRLADLAGSFAPAEADLLVTITWNTDATDIDLHVEEPTGVVCYYLHPLTRIGGTLTRDVTQGYGPEMYCIEDAVSGAYSVRAHYYRGNPNRTLVRTRVLATVYEDWGRPQERRTRRAIPVQTPGEMVDIVRVEVGE